MERIWLLERLAPVARKLGVEAVAAVQSPEVLEGLCVYARELLAWNARVNLTGARTPEAIADEHLADALALLPHLPAAPFHYVDVGSGGGLPGIPIAVLRPDASGVLLEPIGKKRAFLAHAIRTLQVSGLEAVAERLEAHLASGGREAYDVALSRAVWPAREWLVRAAPLLRAGGRALALEGTAGADASEHPGVRRVPYELAGRRRAILISDR